MFHFSVMTAELGIPPWRARDIGGRPPSLRLVEFDRQLDKISLWLEEWSHQQVTSLPIVLSQGETNSIKLDYSLCTLHHNPIKLGHLFAAIALQLLSYFAKYLGLVLYRI